VFAITIGEDPAVKVPPELIKSPPKVSELFEVNKVDPLLIVRGADTANSFAAFMVIIPVFAIITPPVPLNEEIHSSDDAFLAVAVL
jgi:hypothetical protein